jgi:hypothetical protein
MADFFFFTDIDLLNVQTSDLAFGPLNGFENSKYRLCNLHTASSDPSAYAICSGSVFIQVDNTDSTLVNLVLKPSQQPVIDFPTIKYYIYKGIKKTSLIAPGDLEIAASESNDLTKLIWDAQNARNISFDVADENAPGTTTDRPSANALGINYASGASAPYTSTDDDLLSIPFYNSDLDFQIPIVKGGFSIGTFDKDSFGLEIIFDSVMNRPTFGLARSHDHVLNVPELLGGETQALVFDHWNTKEEILHYLDPAAFFGSFYASDLGMKTSFDTEFTLVTGDDIYDQVVKKFFNKNRVYMDLRGELNNGFGYFVNYGTDINISFSESGTLSLVNVNRANWPIFIIDADFPLGNTSDSNNIRLELPKGDNEYPLLIAKTAKSVNSFPSNIQNRQRFIRLVHNDVSTFNLNTIHLKTPNFVDSDTTPIAGYIHLKYVRSLLNIPSVTAGNSQLIQHNGYDHLFYPFIMKSEWVAPSGATEIQVFNEERYVDFSTSLGKSFLANTGVGLNSDGSKTFFAFPTGKHVRSKLKTNDISFIGGIDLKGLPTINILGEEIGALQISEEHNIDEVMVGFDHLDRTVGNVGEVALNLSTTDPQDILYLTFTETEFLTLTAIKDDPSNAFLVDYPISFSLKYLDEGVLDFGKPYFKYEIVLSGFKLDAGINEVVTQHVDTGIQLYQLAQFTGFSEIEF